MPRAAAEGGRGRPNTVNFARRDLEIFLDALDAAGAKESFGARRHFVRWAFRQGSIRLELRPTVGGKSTIRVACRNLSSGGISLLHNSYVHVGTACEVFLPHPTRGEVGIAGTVVRCSHLRGMIHEIGVKFTREISAREFVRLDPLEDAFSLERVDVERLQGIALLVGGSPMDKRLMEHFLGGTCVRLHQANDADAGVALAREKGDVVFADLDLPGSRADVFIASLREAGIETPVVVLAPDRHAAGPVLRTIPGPSGVLIRPLRQDLLLRALAEFLLAPGTGAGALTTTLPAGHPNAPLVGRFVEHMLEESARLSAAVAAGDGKACRTIALQVAGAAESMGFEHVGRVASSAASALGPDGQGPDAAPRVRALLVACQSVRAA